MADKYGQAKFEQYADRMGYYDFEEIEADDDGRTHYRNPFTQGFWNFWCASRNALSPPPAATPAATGGFYVASRASIPERPMMWQGLRMKGWPITSSWIDEAGEGETEDMGELWRRIHAEIARSTGVLLYAEVGDFPLKGALIECGIALGMGKPVALVLPDVRLEPRSMKPVGSWAAHPLVKRYETLEEARAALAQPAPVAAPAPPSVLLTDTELARIYRRVTGATRFDESALMLMREVEHAVNEKRAAPAPAASEGHFAKELAALHALRDEIDHAKQADAESRDWAAQKSGEYRARMEALFERAIASPSTPEPAQEEEQAPSIQHERSEWGRELARRGDKPNGLDHDPSTGEVTLSFEPAAASGAVAPGSPTASAMIDSVLAEYGWPTNPKNAARAGFVAAQRLAAPTSGGESVDAVLAAQRQQIADLILREGFRVSSPLESGHGFGEDIEHRFKISDGVEQFGVVVILTALRATPSQAGKGEV